MKLSEGDRLVPPTNPEDKTFAVLTHPDADGAYWCRLGRQWLRVDGALNVALARSCGCRCVRPLLGWTVPEPWSAYVPTPRCRTCNAEAPHA